MRITRLTFLILIFGCWHLTSLGLEPASGADRCRSDSRALSVGNGTRFTIDQFREHYGRSGHRWAGRQPSGRRTKGGSLPIHSTRRDGHLV